MRLSRRSAINAGFWFLMPLLIGNSKLIRVSKLETFSIIKKLFGIKGGSRVNVHAVKARKPKNIAALYFEQFQGERGIVINVWKYPPHDVKYEVQILDPKLGKSEHKRIVVRESELEVENASS